MYLLFRIIQTFLVGNHNHNRLEISFFSYDTVTDNLFNIINRFIDMQNILQFMIGIIFDKYVVHKDIDLGFDNCSITAIIVKI